MTIIKYLFITLTLLVMNAYLLNSVDKNICENGNMCLHQSLQQDIESILFAKAENFSVKNEDVVIAFALEQLEMIEDKEQDNNTVVLLQITNTSSITNRNKRDKSVNTTVKHVDQVKILDNDNNASKTNNYNVNEEGKYCSC